MENVRYVAAIGQDSLSLLDLTLLLESAPRGLNSRANRSTIRSRRTPGTRAVARSHSSGPRSEPGALLGRDRSVAQGGGERLIMATRVQGPNGLVRVEKKQAAPG